jgi:hypothetical protein
MTKITSLIFAAAICIAISSGCNNGTISTGDGSNKVTGNGKQLSETREITGFSEISLEGAFNVILKQSDKESVTVEADENIVPLIHTEVENGTLKVGMKDNTTFQNMGKLEVTIFLKTITGIKTAGAGSLVSSDTLHVTDLKMDLNGAGATDLKIMADKLTVNSQSVGALQLSGKVKEVAIDQNGVGLIQAFDLKSEKLTLKASGVGAAEVFASQELSIDASGIGSVQYKGGATKTEIKNDGIGKVTCIDCK